MIRQSKTGYHKLVNNNYGRGQYNTDQVIYLSPCRTSHHWSNESHIA